MKIEFFPLKMHPSILGLANELSELYSLKFLFMCNYCEKKSCL